MDAIKEMRRQRGWSQRDLADESGVGQDTISGIESGKHEPRPSTLRKLAAALDIEVADFFREAALPKVDAPPGAGVGRPGRVELLHEYEKIFSDVSKKLRADLAATDTEKLRTLEPLEILHILATLSYLGGTDFVGEAKAMQAVEGESAAERRARRRVEGALAVLGDTAAEIASALYDAADKASERPSRSVTTIAEYQRKRKAG